MVGRRPLVPGEPGSDFGGADNGIGPGIGANTATWTFAVSRGLYSIATTWTASSRAADNAPYTILSNGTDVGFLRVDQQEAPNDLSADGANWKDLGSVVVSGGTLQVQLSDDADGLVIADAVRIERLSNTIVSVAASPSSVPEAGSTGLVYTFTRAGATSGALTVSFGVGGTSVLGTDYTESGAATFTATSGTVTFAPGSATATVTVNPLADTGIDGDHSVVLTVSAGSGYAVSSPSSATGIITDDDTNAQVSVAASPSSVPADSTTGLVYTFTRAGATSGAPDSIVQCGRDGRVRHRLHGEKRRHLRRHVRHRHLRARRRHGHGDHHAPGRQRRRRGRPVGHLDRRRGRRLRHRPSKLRQHNHHRRASDGGCLARLRGGKWDGQPGLHLHAHGAPPPATVSFGVGGTAVLGTDYTETGAATFTATAGTVTFAAGSSTATVTLVPIAHGQPNLDKTAVLTLSYGSGYGIGPSRVATGTITDDRVFVDISCFPTWVAKDGTNDLVYTLTRTGSTAGALTVSFGVGGTAVLGTDYTESGAATFTAKSGTVTFAPGSATAAVTLAPLPDNETEPNETAVLTVSAGSSYLVGGYSQVTGTITDTSAIVSVVVSPASVASDGVTGLVYTFTRSGSAALALTASFSVGGTAVFKTDYTETAPPPSARPRAPSPSRPAAPRPP